MNKKGVTLLEAIITITILMILASAGIFTYTAFNNDRHIKSGAEEISSILSAARNYAIANKEYYQVVLYFQNGSTENVSYWIDQTDQYGAIQKAKITTPKSIPDFVIVDKNDIAFKIVSNLSWNTNLDGSIYKIVFMADGTSDYAQIPLKLKNSSIYYTIVLFAPTAKVKVFEKEKKDFTP